MIVDDNTGSPEAWESVVGRVGKEGITVLRVASRLGAGVGFARDEIFEVVDHPARHHRTDVPSATHRRNGRGADPSRPPMLRAGGKFFAHADQLSVPRAYRYARAMARWTPTASVDVTDSGSGALELLRALGIDDARELNVDRLWAERRSRGDERWAEIPVGPNRTVSCRTSCCAQRTSAASASTRW